MQQDFVQVDVQKCRICPNASSIVDSATFLEFVTPWVFCSNCHQEYQNELRKLILPASKFVLIRPKAVPTWYKKACWELCALDSMFKRLWPVQEKKEIVGVTATVLLSKIYGWLLVFLKQQTQTAYSVEVHSKRERRKVLGGRWFTLRTNWRLAKQIGCPRGYRQCKGQHSLCQVKNTNMVRIMRSCWRQTRNCTKFVSLNTVKGMNMQSVQVEALPYGGNWTIDYATDH